MSPPTQPEAEVSVFDLVTPLLRRWKLVVFFPLALATTAATLSFIVTPTFTAVTTFTPEAATSVGLTGGLTGLAGLAGQLGISTGAAGNLTPEFFASVLKSRELLEAALTSQFNTPHRAGERQTLLELMNVGGTNPEEQKIQGVRRLRSLTNTTVDTRTGIVTLRVAQADPQLAADVANRLTEILNQFNLERRQSQSREQRRFAAQRLAEAESELRAAEERMLHFLQANRQYRGSPLLEYEANRLQREVQLKQEVFLTLTKAYEDARIAEVRDTPVLTIIDEAVPPFIRTSPHRILWVLVALVLGGILAAAIAFLMESRSTARQGDRPDYQAFSEAWVEARRQMRGLFHRPDAR